MCEPLHARRYVTELADDEGSAASRDADDEARQQAMGEALAEANERLLEKELARQKWVQWSTVSHAFFGHAYALCAGIGCSALWQLVVVSGLMLVAWPFVQARDRVQGLAAAACNGRGGSSGLGAAQGGKPGRVEEQGG